MTLVRKFSRLKIGTKSDLYKPSLTRNEGMDLRCQQSIAITEPNERVIFTTGAYFEFI
jgi:hypothetical protein